MPSTEWTRTRALAIAAGGASGAGCRWLAIEAAGEMRFPWPVLIVNVVGSFALGALLAEADRSPHRRSGIRDLGAIGFCGGLTTFSTFAVEVVELLDDGDAVRAAIYVIASLAGALAAVALGSSLARRLGGRAASAEARA